MYVINRNRWGIGSYLPSFEYQSCSPLYTCCNSAYGGNGAF